MQLLQTGSKYILMAILPNHAPSGHQSFFTLEIIPFLVHFGGHKSNLLTVTDIMNSIPPIL